MRIWVDADACPRPIKEVLFRAAAKREVRVTLVANQYLKTPPSPWIDALQVPGGFDVADNEILRLMASGDIVITADVPLADEVVSAGGVALNPRGTQYTAANIKDHLQRRDMMDELRGMGEISGGPKAFDNKNVQQFSNALDRPAHQVSVRARRLAVYARVSWVCGARQRIAGSHAVGLVAQHRTQTGMVRGLAGWDDWVVRVVAARVGPFVWRLQKCGDRAPGPSHLAAVSVLMWIPPTTPENNF